MGSLTIENLESLLQTLSVEPPVPHFPRADITNNPIDIYRCFIADAIVKLVGCDRDAAFDSIQWTSSIANGDLVIVAPRLKLKGAKPQELAQKIALEFPTTPLVKQPVANGIFVPIYFAGNALSHLVMPYIFDRKRSYGTQLIPGLKDPESPAAGKKKVIVEFSSPNIAKEFHAGHLRSTIIGSYISNLHESMGWEVIKINYLGDWGKQFGLLAVGWERFGSEELFASNPLRHLLDVYARISALFKPEQEASQQAREKGQDTSGIESRGLFAERNAFFKRMEDGEPEALALWRRFRDVSVERYISTYSRLNIAFDEYSGESTVRTETLQKVERILKEKGLYEENQGSWIIDFRKHGAPKLDIAVVRNRMGTTTYLLRDIAAVLERVDKHGFDKMIYVVAAEQDLYFQRLFKTIELMGYTGISASLSHVNFGKVQGMSSRLGTVKLLSDILNECGSAMHEVMRTNEKKYSQVENPDAVADTLGITAVMVQDMSGKRINNYPFDMTRMTSFEGDTGPYLQYSHARLCSIMRKAQISPEDIARADFSLLKEPHAIDILRLMAQYPDVTNRAFEVLEPATILTYLFRLTHQVSSSYDVLKVIGAAEGPEVALARAALYEAARQVIGNGMRLLGFTPVDRM
ncbi:hypothetical protein FQN54_000088 [Arachnomyces sp. PD_36]|nr:hypothetical protein FQN54_000088 [Arachnomyces sp. PD_36]